MLNRTDGRSRFHLALFYALFVHSLALGSYAIWITIDGDAFDLNRTFLFLVSPITLPILMLSNMGVLLLFRNGRKFAGSMVAVVLLTISEVAIAIAAMVIFAWMQ